MLGRGSSGPGFRFANLPRQQEARRLNSPQPDLPRVRMAAHASAKMHPLLEWSESPN